MSSVSPQDIRLCEHILSQLYGHAAGEIGSILLNRGRLPFSSLLRMSSLTAHSVRAALIVMIHQNCVSHSDTSVLTSNPKSDPISSANATSSGGPENFEAIPEEILARVRFGQYINLTYEHFGIESKLIVEFLLENGKLRIGQLTTMVCDQYHSPKRSKLDHQSENQINHSPLKTPQIVRSNVLNLLAERYIKPSHPTHAINPVDLELAFEKQYIAALPGVPGPKDIKAAKERVADRILEHENEIYKEMCSFEQKRQALASSQNDRNEIHNKRQKTQEVPLEDDMFVRVNYDRFNIKIRNAIFEQECFRSYNLEAGLVIRAMLSLAEGKQKDCRDLVSDGISAQTIVMKLGNQSSMVKTTFPARAANNQFNLKLKNTGDLVAELLSVMSKQDDLATSTSSVYVTGTLSKSLAQLNPLPVVSEKKNNVLGGGSGSGGMREFKVEYAKYSLELRKALVARIIREKFGIEAARVVRILMHKGRLDEKHLAKFAMMTLKDSRELCLKLSVGKILELQEVPKTQDRQPSRTYYLYFIDFQKLILNIKMMIRKSQTNLMIRADFELSRYKNLIEKVNRTDVIQDQEGLLTVWEQADLKKLTKIIQALEVAKLRLERDIFILNDLPWLV